MHLPLLLLALSLGAETPSLWFQGPPDGLTPCSRELFVGAIRRHRPLLAIRDGAGDSGDVSALITAGEASWSLTVEGPGQEPLHRSLPLPAADCLATADTAALMLDRYLDQLPWDGPSVTIGGLEREAAPTPRAILGVLELGGAVERTPTGFLPTLELDAAARRGPWQLGLGGTVALPAQTSVDPGLPGESYAVQTASARVVGGWRVGLGFGTLRLELAPGVELLWVRVQTVPVTAGPQLFANQPGFAAVPCVGARVAYEVSLPWRLALALRLQARVFIGQASLGVEGYPAPVVTPPVDGNLALVLSRLFF